MHFEEQILINATAAEVYSLYADVNGWPSWDPEVQEVTLDGTFVHGAEGSLRPSNGPEARIRIIWVIPNHSFTVESRLPLCRMRFEHEIFAEERGVRAVHRVVFRGLLSPFFAWVVGRKIHKGLPDTLRGLKAAAEALRQG